MASSVSHIKIWESVNATEPVEVPLERDGTLLLSTLIGQHPDSVGLRCKANSGAWRGLRCIDNTIHPPDSGWGNTDYYVVFGTGSETGGESSLKRSSQDDGGPVTKYQRTGYVQTDEKPKPATPKDDTPAQKAFQARLEIVTERWRKINGPSPEMLAKVAEFNARPKKEPVVQTLREPGVTYKPVEANTRGFHILVKQGLTRLLGRGRVVDEAIRILKRYYYHIHPGGEQVHFEYKQLDNDENNTLLYIESDVQDPAQVTSAVYRDMLSRNCSQPDLEILKCWIKFLPVHKTCTSEMEDVVATVKEVVEPAFQLHQLNPQRPLTFQLQVKGNNWLFRQLKFDHLQQYMISRGAAQECWRADSEHAIFVRFTEELCFVSMLWNNKSFSSYTVSQVFRDKLGFM